MIFQNLSQQLTTPNVFIIFLSNYYEISLKGMKYCEAAFFLSFKTLTLGSTKGKICQFNPKIAKKKRNLQKKVFTNNEHSEMPCIITGINFICLEHSMTGSYKEDWSVKVAGKQKTHCGSGEKHIGSWF